MYIYSSANDSIALYTVSGNNVRLIWYFSLYNWATHCIWCKYCLPWNL